MNISRLDALMHLITVILETDGTNANVISTTESESAFGFIWIKHCPFIRGWPSVKALLPCVLCGVFESRCFAV